MIKSNHRGRVTGVLLSPSLMALRPARLLVMAALWLMPAVCRVGAADATVTHWGDNRFGQSTAPSSLGGVKAISAGARHTVALKNDGTVAAWGYNNSGEATVPSGLGEVIAVAAGGYHTVVLMSDGTVRAWGARSIDYGQTAIPRGLGRVKAVAAGSFHTVALLEDGTIAAWGDNRAGQTNVPPDLAGVRAIAAGGAHTMALRSDGTIVAWGRNGNGESTVPAGLRGVTAIAAGFIHSVALKSDETVAAWGENRDGQTTIPAGLRGVSAISAGSEHTVALTHDGTVVAWGVSTRTNDYGQTVIPEGLGRVRAIAAGGTHTLALIGGDVVGSGAARLLNLSVRGQAGTGAQRLIAGFVISGPGSKRILLRGVGPALFQFGVTGVLADPVLTLYGGASEVLASNDNWGGDPQITAAGDSVGAFRLGLAASRDAALLVTLLPGNYTAQVSGVDGTVGVALAEVYEMP